MKEDFSELVEYLDKKFEQTATKEEVCNISVRLINVEEDLKEIKGELKILSETVHELVGAVDKLAKAVEDLLIEYSATAMKVDRHEKWILQIAEKLGIKLQY